MWRGTKHECDNCRSDVGWRWRRGHVPWVNSVHTWRWDSDIESHDRILNLVAVMTSAKQQPFYIGMTGFSYGSGYIPGPVVGGLLADSPATWRWVSLSNKFLV